MGRYPPWANGDSFFGLSRVLRFADELTSEGIFSRMAGVIDLRNPVPEEERMTTEISGDCVGDGADSSHG